MLLTRTRSGALVVVAVALVALMALLPNIGASAATHSVSVGSPTNRFTPNAITIPVGDSVTFTWAAGTHTVIFQGASPDLTINSSNTSGQTKAFTTPGTYYYFCSIHAEASDATEAHVQANDAMVGKIVVSASAGATTPTAATTATPVATTPAGTVAPNGQCVLTVKDAVVTAGSKQIVIPRSQQGRAGYIAIHESSAAGAPGAVIGITSYEPAGTSYTALAVGLDRAIKDGETLWPMLHTEDNGNTTYDGAAVDLPTVDSACGNAAVGNIVTFPMKLTFGTPGAPATGNAGPANDSNTDWTLMALGGAVGLVVVSGATAFAVRGRSRN